MHAPYDRSRKDSSRTEPRSGVGFIVLPVLIAMVLIALVMVHPKASTWISQAVQAEFDGSGIAEDMPVETVRPVTAEPMRTVHAN
jgi:hypothetical protein